ncbi:MAG: ferrochelatase [Actinomycetota bacterium]|nr:ferrochelatase [Actinomycetota bacterium]
MSTKPIGVLVMAYGTASGPHDIERYYTDIRGGRPPSPEALAELAGRYAAIGNTFPLAAITRAQAEGLEAALNRDRPGAFRAYVGNKHSPPFVGDAVARMAGDGIERGVGVVLAPHYSRMSIGGYMARIDAALAADGSLRITTIESWYDHPAFLAVLADRVAEARGRLADQERSNDLTVFTAHSLPRKILEHGDPYPDQLQATADLVAGRLGLRRYRIGWQSEGRTPEPWIGPPLEEVIEKAAADGHTAVVVAPCGFTSDHLEILYDLDIEARQVAARAGIPLVRTESMNDDPRFLDALASVVRDHLAAAPA